MLSNDNKLRDKNKYLCVNFSHVHKQNTNKKIFFFFFSLLVLPSFFSPRGKQKIIGKKNMLQGLFGDNGAGHMIHT